VSNTSNASALIFHGLRARNEADVNWVGFYVKNSPDEELILGPFQGEVACVIIPPGKGVCGAAAKRRTTVVRRLTLSAEGLQWCLLFFYLDVEK